MTRIESAVQDALPEGAYSQRTVLDEGTLDSVRHANDEFLELVARQYVRTSEGDVLGLGRPTARRIAALGPGARDFASRCPYSLFNLRLEDAPFWRSVVRDAQRPVKGAPPSGAPMSAAPMPAAAMPDPRRVGVPAAPVDEAAFARTAVFLAWHLAQSSDLAAAIALGMTPEVQAAWRALPVPNVDRAATLALPHLRARWGGHARFWPKLLDAAADPTPEQAERVRLLGLQLLAADGVRPQLAQFARRGGRTGGPAAATPGGTDARPPRGG